MVRTRSSSRACYAQAPLELLGLCPDLLGVVASALDLRSLAAAASTSVSIRAAVHSCTSTSKRQRAIATLLRIRNEPMPPSEQPLTSDARLADVDFIFDVCSAYSLRPSTACLAVQYFDRCMSVAAALDRSNELVCLVAALLASKFSDTAVPNLESLCLLSENTFTREDIKDAELMLLERLGWDLNPATPLCFLEQLAIALDVDGASRKGAESYINMAYYDCAVLGCTPMAVAASALLLSWQKRLCEGQPARLSELALLCGVDQTVLTQLQSDIDAQAAKLEGR